MNVFIYFESVGFILFGTYLVNIDMYDNSEDNYTNAVCDNFCRSINTNFPVPNCYQFCFKFIFCFGLFFIVNGKRYAVGWGFKLGTIYNLQKCLKGYSLSAV